MTDPTVVIHHFGFVFHALRFLYSISNIIKNLKTALFAKS
ncbi:hypothetical protein A672_03845 [Salmonella enterica subsp. enterica serovar Enteritidis str. 08-1080]|nr:hypothetical protein A672_03845 [Salmonella enterica subsp. enterica serovar Enteritidis str. 08-1080]